MGWVLCANRTALKLTDLKPDTRNANRGTDRGARMIEQSLRQYGAGRSILVDKDGNIIAGNKTVEAAQKAGIQTVRVIETDGTEIIAVKRTDLDIDSKEGRELAVADNRTNQVSLEWDAEVLQELIDEGADMSALFDQGEIEQMFAAIADYGEGDDGLLDGVDPDEIPEAAEPVCKLGDLWQLGRHRLICGSSTDAAAVSILMDGALADCMWTDPPYGVNYVGKTKDALTIENDGKENLPELCDAFLAIARSALKEGSPYYIAHPPGVLSLTFGNALIKAGWRLHETLVWVKDSMVLGHSDYHYKHEPIYYGWTPGEGRSGRGNHNGSRWYGDNAQVSVFEIDRPKRNSQHPTMKPVALVDAMLLNSTTQRHIVYEPFGGSGTTLISCEGIGRACRCVELSPHYCDVIISRWENATGKKAELLGNYGTAS